MTQELGTSEVNPDEYAWLGEVLGGIGVGRPTQYLVRPSVAEPQLLLPLQPSRVTAAAMRRHHDGRGPKEKLVGLAAELAARAGLLKYAGGEVHELAPFGLISRLADELNEPDLIAAISIGPRRRNRKPVIQLLKPSGDSVGFVKVGWSGLTRELVSNEAHWLREVEGKLPSPLAAPRVLLRHTDEHTDTVVTSPLPIKAALRPPPPMTAALMLGLARCTGSDQVPVSDLGTVSDIANAAKVGPIDLPALLERHGDVEVEAGIWHGDLTPWNTATGPDATLLWDWEFAAGQRPVGFDLLHTAFEKVRRAQANNEEAAVRTILNEASSILRPVTGRAVAQPVVDAYCDLYLAELIARETRLAGEGWRPANLGPLDQVAAEALRRRLAA